MTKAFVDAEHILKCSQERVMIIGDGIDKSARPMIGDYDRKDVTAPEVGRCGWRNRTAALALAVSGVSPNETDLGFQLAEGFGLIAVT
jgi:hypothetical protein